MVITNPDRDPRLATREWTRSEGDGPGSFWGVSGSRPAGW